MPFVKLDCGIVKSTLWVDRECREVFLSALLMAEPRELFDPTPQIEVRTLTPTGFVVPAGWYGFVDAAGIGIVRVAAIEIEAGMQALERLGSPDPESRSQDYEGRRLVRVDGGYVVLNYMRYREHDYRAAERMRRYRQRKKDGVTVTGSDVRRTFMSPLRIAEAEADKSKNPSAVPTPPTRKPPKPDPDWLAPFKLVYPPRAGGMEWRRAVRAGNARIEEGHTPDELITGARRYAIYLRVIDKLGTEFVKQPATFLGPEKPFLLPWDPPPKRINGHSIDPQAEAAWDALLASEGAVRDGRVESALGAIGGWMRVRMRKTVETMGLKREFCAAWVAAGDGYG